MSPKRIGAASRAGNVVCAAVRHEVAEQAALDLRERFDSVYFFIWPGWRGQLESNRWHWGKRWALKLPVVFIHPELPAGVPSHVEPEGRLENSKVR